MAVLPIGSQGEPHFVPARSTPEQRTKLAKAIEAFNDAALTMTTYVSDIEIEAQRLLLGPLFPKGSVQRRQPTDDKYKVLVTDDVEAVKALKGYFEKETAFGRRWQAAKQRHVDASTKKPYG